MKAKRKKIVLPPLPPLPCDRPWYAYDTHYEPEKDKTRFVKKYELDWVKDDVKGLKRKVKNNEWKHSTATLLFLVLFGLVAFMLITLFAIA